MHFAYNAALQLAWILLKCVSLFSKKANEFTKGRLSNHFEPLGCNFIWIHCASVGEFEQGRPLIELIKKKYPQEKILLSFFSPSGFKHLKNYALADQVVYAPFDSKKQVTKFLKSYTPKALILVKYEFWKNLIYHTSISDIPIFSVSSIFRKDQHFFRWYGEFFAKDLKKVNHFFVQNSTSKKLLSELHIDQTTITGDTRFDRVISISEKSEELSLFNDFCNVNEKCIVAGSTWPKDENLLKIVFEGLDSEWKLIIAPHEVTAQRINELSQLFKEWKPIQLSNSLNSELINSRIVIIDSIGILNRIYKIATITYLGGGFGAGIHNILEAAVWGKPVLFGPKHEKFTEATDLLALGGAISFENEADGVQELLTLHSNSESCQKMGEISREYIYRNKGATLKVFSYLESEGIFK